MEIHHMMEPSQTILPNPAVIRRLRKYDEKLNAFLNVVNDRWTIVRYIPVARYEGSWRGLSLFSCMEVPWPVLCVQDLDGGYMPLDERAIVMIWESDLHRIDDIDRHLDKADQRMLDNKRKMERDLADDIRHATLENKRQLIKSFEPFDRDYWQEKELPTKPMSHEPVKVEWDDISF